MNTKPPTLRLAVAEFLTSPGDVAGNLDRLEALAREAGGRGARLVLFSEAGVTGYTPDSPALQEGDEAFSRLSRIAADAGLILVAGFLEARQGKIHNTQGAFFPGGEVVLQRKFRAAGVEEKIPNFAGAEGPRLVFEVDGVRAAIVICADFIPEVWEELAAARVELVLVATAGCGPREWGFSQDSLHDPATLERYLVRAESVVFSSNAIRDALGHHVALATCNHLADNGRDYFHPGHSMIVDRTGDLVALIPGSFVFEHLRPRLAVGDIRLGGGEVA